MTRRMLATAVAAMLLAGLAACGDSGDDAAGDTAATAPPAATTDAVPPLAMRPPPALEVDGLRSDTPGGVVNAAPADGTTYVGPLGDDFSVAVSLAEGAGGDAPRDALVYVCDGQGGTYLTGEAGPGTTTLRRGGVAVQLTRDGDGAVSGTVAFGDEEPRPFTAEPATGDAGLYGAEFAAGGVDYRPVWVVQHDGTQRGGACWQCCSGAGCDICCPAPADVAGPTVDPEPETWWQRWFRR